MGCKPAPFSVANQGRAHKNGVVQGQGVANRQCRANNPKPQTDEAAEGRGWWRGCRVTPILVHDSGLIGRTNSVQISGPQETARSLRVIIEGGAGVQHIVAEQSLARFQGQAPDGRFG